MSIKNSILVCILLSISPLLAQNSYQNDVSKKITAVANEENVTNADLEKAYIAFKAAYYYGREFDFEGSIDFGQVADKQRKIVSRLNYVANQKLSDTIYETLKKYEDYEFDSRRKSEYMDDCYYIAKGLREAME
jgi:hypothetical protein